MRRWLMVGFGLMMLIGMGWFALSRWPSPAEPRRAVYRGSAAGIAAWGAAFTTAGVTVQPLTDPLPTEPMSVLYLDAEALDQLDVAWLRTQYGRETMIIGIDVQPSVLGERVGSPLTAENLARREHAIIASNAMRSIGMFRGGETFGVAYYPDITTLITKTQDNYRSAYD